MDSRNVFVAIALSLAVFYFGVLFLKHQGLLLQNNSKISN